MMLCIYPIVAEHLEMFFGDVDNQFFDEVQSRNGFSNRFVIFVSGVMEGYIITIIIINTRCGNDRSAEKPSACLLYISFLTLRKAGPIREESCSSSTLRKALRRKT